MTEIQLNLAACILVVAGRSPELGRRVFAGSEQPSHFLAYIQSSTPASTVYILLIDATLIPFMLQQ